MTWTRKAVLIAVGCGGMIMHTGCAHITTVRTEELRAVQTHVDSLRGEMTGLQKEIIRQQKEHNELLRLIRADQQVKFGEVGQKISSLEGSVTESQQRLTKIDEKTQAIKQKWDEKSRADSLTESLQSDEMNGLFKLAYDDFMTRRYDLAASGFLDFRVQYPETPLAEEAGYWIAECHYAQGASPKAEAAYKDYIREYPEGKKICVALYKLGMVYSQAGRDKPSRMVWKKLVEQCPDSEEANAVKSRLE